MKQNIRRFLTSKRVEHLFCPGCKEPFETDPDQYPDSLKESHIPITSASNCPHLLCCKCIANWKGKTDDKGWIPCLHDECGNKKSFHLRYACPSPVAIELVKAHQELQHLATVMRTDTESAACSNEIAQPLPSANASAGSVEEIEKPALDEISYLLRCDICWERFETDASQYPTDKEKRTSRLPVRSHKCSHTMCCKCLVQFEQAEKPKSGWMPCKICNLKTAFRTSSMVLDTTLSAMIAFVDPSTFQPANFESTDNNGGSPQLVFRPVTRLFHKKQAAAKENEIKAAIDAGRLTPREDGRLTPREAPTSTTDASAAAGDGVEVEHNGEGAATAASTTNPPAETKASFEESDLAAIAPGVNVAAAVASSASSIRDIDGKDDDSSDKKPAAITTNKETVSPAAAASAAAKAAGNDDTKTGATTGAKKPSADVVMPSEENVPPAPASAPTNKNGVPVSNVRNFGDIAVDDDGKDGKRPATDTETPSGGIVTSAAAAANADVDSSAAEKPVADLEKPLEDMTTSPYAASELIAKEETSIEIDHRILRCNNDLLALSEALTKNNDEAVVSLNNSSFVAFLENNYPHVATAYDALLKSLRVQEEIEAGAPMTEDYLPVDRQRNDLLDLLEPIVATIGSAAKDSAIEDAKSESDDIKPGSVTVENGAQFHKSDAVSAPASCLAQANPSRSSRFSGGRDGALKSARPKNFWRGTPRVGLLPRDMNKVDVAFKNAPAFASMEYEMADSTMECDLLSPGHGRGKRPEASVSDTLADAFVKLSDNEEYAKNKAIAFLKKGLKQLGEDDRIAATQLEQIEVEHRGEEVFALMARLKRNPGDHDARDELNMLEARFDSCRKHIISKKATIHEEISSIEFFVKRIDKNWFVVKKSAPSLVTEASCNSFESTNVAPRPPGTGRVEYSVTSNANGLAPQILQAITAMDEYGGASIEELRHEDYNAGNRGLMKKPDPQVTGKQDYGSLGGLFNVSATTAQDPPAHEGLGLPNERADVTKVNFGFGKSTDGPALSRRKMPFSFGKSLDHPSSSSTGADASSKYPGPPAPTSIGANLDVSDDDLGAFLGFAPRSSKPSAQGAETPVPPILGLTSNGTREGDNGNGEDEDDDL